MSRMTTVLTAPRDELADAADPSLHRTHMALLAQSRQRTVREALAARRDLPLGLQAVLADDEWHAVRATIASNPKAARSVLERLTQDKHRAVLVALIANPDVPRDLVENLTEHKRPEVREAASTRLRLNAQFRVEQELTPDERIPELQDRVVAAREAGALEATTGAATVQAAGLPASPALPARSVATEALAVGGPRPFTAPATTFVPATTAAFVPALDDPHAQPLDDSGPMWVTTAILRGRMSAMPGFPVSTVA